MDALRQAQQKGVVIGLKALQESGPVPRLDIDELLTTKPDTFNLFLLALSELQNDKFTSDKMGYYQITGKMQFAHLGRKSRLRPLVQVSMVFHDRIGMASGMSTKRSIRNGQVKATVLTHAQLSQHGIARTWLCMRCVTFGPM